MGSSLPERPQSSRLSSIGPESEQSLLSQHRRVVEEQELEYNSCYKTTVSRISICSTFWGNLFLPIFTLWEVLFPPLLSARSSTGEVGAAPILLEWNQVLYVSFYFFDDFECKNLGGKENELRPQ